jgi:hypothetical protein
MYKIRRGLGDKIFIRNNLNGEIMSMTVTEIESPRRGRSPNVQIGFEDPNRLFEIVRGEQALERLGVEQDAVELAR